MYANINLDTHVNLDKCKRKCKPKCKRKCTHKYRYEEMKINNYLNESTYMNIYVYFLFGETDTCLACAQAS